MMIEKTKITFVPPMRQDDHGWLDIDGEILLITKIHSFDDFGQTLDTLTLEDGQEVYSHDEGETFFTQDGSY